MWSDVVRKIVLVTLTVASVGNLNAQVADNPAIRNVKTNSDKSSAPDIGSDLDGAIQVLDKSDFRTFYERYAPVELLRQLRQEEMLDEASEENASRVLLKAQLLMILRSIRKETPTYDKSHGLATYKFDPYANQAFKLDKSELHLPDTDNLKLVGLGGDLTKVIAQAAQLLDDGDIKAFVERTFPASELARLQTAELMQDLIHRINTVPVVPKPKRGQRAPKPGDPAPLSLRQAFQADFKRLQELKPELTDKGLVAVFRLDSPNKQPPRVIKFQKVGADWRFFDNAGRVASELSRQSKLKPSYSATTVQFELVGGNWRFVEIPPIVW